MWRHNTGIDARRPHFLADVRTLGSLQVPMISLWKLCRIELLEEGVLPCTPFLEACRCLLCTSVRLPFLADGDST